MATREEWLNWRHKGLGASDVSALYGLHYSMTAYDLWKSKTSPVFMEQEASFAAQMGNDLEPKARERFAALFNFDHFSDETFEPARVEMKDFPFMLASLDGASKDMKTLIVIKFMSRPSVDAMDKLTPGKVKHLAVLNGEIPEAYRIQIQHQLLVTGAESCHFISYEPPPIPEVAASMNSCIILPDLEFMVNHLRKCEEFWDLVRSRVAPPLVADDYKNLRVKGGKALAQAYKQNPHELIKKELMGMMTEDRMHIDGLYLNRLTNEVR